MYAALMLPAMRARMGERADKFIRLLARLSVFYVAFSLVTLHFQGFLPPRYSPCCTVFRKFLQPTNVLMQNLQVLSQGFVLGNFASAGLSSCVAHTEVITLIRTAFLARRLECISLLQWPSCGMRLLFVLFDVSIGGS